MAVDLNDEGLFEKRFEYSFILLGFLVAFAIFVLNNFSQFVPTLVYFYANTSFSFSDYPSLFSFYYALTLIYLEIICFFAIIVCALIVLMWGFYISKFNGKHINQENLCLYANRLFSVGFILISFCFVAVISFACFEFVCLFFCRIFSISIYFTKSFSALSILFSYFIISKIFYPFEFTRYEAILLLLFFLSPLFLLILNYSLSFYPI